MKKKQKKTKSKVGPYPHATLQKCFPQHTVAENEIYMSFIHDDDAACFQDWWYYNDGSTLFHEYLIKAKTDFRGT